MSVKIGWCVHSQYEWNELIYSIPESLDLNEGHSAQYVRCPAVKHYCKNTFVIKSAFDIHLRFDKVSKSIKYVEGSLDPNLVKEIIVQFHPKEWRNDLTPIFQLNIDNGFVADQPVWMEVMPPFYNTPKYPGLITPGTFDIYSWQRMISYGFEWLESDKDYIIRRGDPLMYVRFRSEDPSDSFKLVKIKMDDQLKRDINKCQSVKFVLKDYSWGFMKLNRKLRAKRYIK